MSNFETHWIFFNALFRDSCGSGADFLFVITWILISNFKIWFFHFSHFSEFSIFSSQLDHTEVFREKYF